MRYKKFYHCNLYSDTDSLYLEKPFDDKFVGKKLGQFKLECKVKEAKFISPKVYEVVDENKSRKIVFKGLKSEETNEDEISILFTNIIENNSETKKIYEVNRITNFKINFKFLRLFVVLWLIVAVVRRCCGCCGCCCLLLLMLMGVL